MIQKIAVLGAGTMGRGIAFYAAQQNIEVVLCEQNNSILSKSSAWVENELKKLLQKEKITQAEATQIQARMLYTNDVQNCIAPLVIEAIIEDIGAKKSLYSQIESINNEKTIIVSNTSSLSITQLSKDLNHPERFAGLHFFNPATLMRLVEIVNGLLTNMETIESLKAFVSQIKKTYVLAKDSPGFIVNRVARHYYVESLKILEEGGACIDEIDALLESVGFKMGPFKLMDMIGNDINYAVTESLYNAFHYDPKFRPSRIQQQKVLAGHLGVKTGQGFYQYASK